MRRLADVPTAPQGNMVRRTSIIHPFLRVDRVSRVPQGIIVLCRTRRVVPPAAQGNLVMRRVPPVPTAPQGLIVLLVDRVPRAPQGNLVLRVKRGVPTAPQGHIVLLVDRVPRAPQGNIVLRVDRMCVGLPHNFTNCHAIQVSVVLHHTIQPLLVIITVCHVCAIPINTL